MPKVLLFYLCVVVVWLMIEVRDCKGRHDPPQRTGKLEQCYAMCDDAYDRCLAPETRETVPKEKEAYCRRWLAVCQVQC